MRRGPSLVLFFFLCLFTPIVYAMVYHQEQHSLTQTILNTNNYYDPSSDISSTWDVNGSSTHFGALDDGIRNGSTPDLTGYIYSVQHKIDEVGFPAIGESGVTSIILWVYCETGSNGKLIISLKNEGAMQASLTVNASSQGWSSIEWLNPAIVGGLTAEFNQNKQGGGRPQSSFVYATYLEIIFTP